MNHKVSDSTKSQDLYKIAGDYLSNNPFSEFPKDVSGVIEKVGSAVLYFGIGKENIALTEDINAQNAFSTKIDYKGNTELSFSNSLQKFSFQAKSEIKPLAKFKAPY
jgi:hypothetical protein